MEGETVGGEELAITVVAEHMVVAAEADEHPAVGRLDEVVEARPGQRQVPRDRQDEECTREERHDGADEPAEQHAPDQTPEDAQQQDALHRLVSLLWGQAYSIHSSPQLFRFLLLLLLPYR